MRRILLWIANITGWVLDAKELYLLAGTSPMLGAIVTGIITFLSNLPTWLLVIIVVGLTVILFVGLGYLWDWIKGKRARQKSKQRILIQQQSKLEGEIKGYEIVKILTYMHERRRYFRTIRERQKIDRKLFEEATPILLDKLGVVKQDEWEDTKKQWEKDMRKLVPKSQKKLLEGGWRYLVIGKGTQIKNELLGNRKWQPEDGIKVAEWLDNLNIGLAELQDTDPKYLELLNKARPYMSDAVLRKLIDRHISLSYVYHSVQLDIRYSKRWVKNRFDKMAHSELVGSGISPHKIELALGEIIETITNRMKKLEIMDKERGNDKKKRPLLNGFKVNEDVDGAEAVKGLEVENQDIELRNTSIDLRVRNVREVTGASFKQTNKPALSSYMIICECGERIGYVCSGTPPSSIKCPKCGKEHDVH